MYNLLPTAIRPYFGPSDSRLYLIKDVKCYVFLAILISSFFLILRVRNPNNSVVSPSPT